MHPRPSTPVRRPSRAPRLARPALAALAALGALALAAAPAAAQRPHLSLGGGATLPTGDLDDVTGTGWHGLVSMGYRPALFPFGFRVDGSYHDLRGETVGTVRGPDFRAISVTGNVVLEAPGLAVRPYLIGGAGLYNTRVESLASRNSVGLNGGVGLRFQLMDFESFVEARYHSALDAIADGEERRPAHFVPITFGITF